MPDSMGMPESNKKYVASHSHSRREVHVHYGELNVLTGCSECCGKTPKFHPRKTLPLTQTRFQSPWSTSSRRQRARPWIRRTPVSQRGLGEAQARWRVRRPGHPRGRTLGTAGLPTSLLFLWEVKTPATSVASRLTRCRVTWLLKARPELGAIFVGFSLLCGLGFCPSPRRAVLGRRPLPFALGLYTTSVPKAPVTRDETENLRTSRAGRGRGRTVCISWDHSFQFVQSPEESWFLIYPVRM